jgi:2Fe-2S ferredoxin
VPDQPAIPFRLLRAGLRLASRASTTVVDRVLRDGAATTGAVAPRSSRVATGPLLVEFDGREVPARAGATVLEAAQQSDVEIRSYCGGNCSCGTCRIEIVAGAENLSRPMPMEQLVLGGEAHRRGDRLACQAQILGSVKVRVPEFW